ncbi:response regulator [Actomonas aquatica]|uniref:Response regulator n=1 Tax=Actomonas aquatica TaxID=2866162 RepID=A0ABZ1C500_9BACT|nr:response regulator [Opitutus sp. WL0086]WRQ86674.1 response regulator [Opitutus sp. WL0086]
MQPTQTLKIAIVDDSMFMRRMVRSAVKECFPAAELLEYGDGQAAIEQLPAESPDLILLDLLMPRLNGQDTLAQLRALGVKSPIIVVTADVQQSVRDRVRELGAQGFIQKPITYEKLKTVLGEVMSS